MEVIYPKACGVDVHKTFIVAVICDSTTITPKYYKKRFSTFNNDLIKFRNWLLDNDCQNVCMESTGKYYIPVYNALEGFISNVVVANPKWVKCIKGEKYVCNYCHNTLELPIEVIEVFDFIYSVGK